MQKIDGLQKNVPKHKSIREVMKIIKKVERKFLFTYSY